MYTLISIIGVLFIVGVVNFAIQKHRMKNDGPSIPSGPHPHDNGGPPSDVDRVS